MNDPDLTVIYLTANQQPEHWRNYQISILMEAIGDYPLITVCRESMIMPGTILLDDGPKSHLNMYKQMLRAAKMAHTPYIAAAEDDVLYHKAHFKEFRPPLDAFAYDLNRWVVMTWSDKPMYSMKNRISNSVGILPRELFIEAWEERLAKFPGDSMPIHRVSEVGRNNQEEWMGVTQRKRADYFASVSTIHVNHDAGTDSLGHRKAPGPIQAYDVPYWREAQKIVDIYNGVGKRG